ncbi:hypothetical protein FJM67_05000 [Maribrevibacterium harenarium]|uniref:Uncharacterized protein n=1 Tax=Maribrevibacterium harenarium TaxID=2589817 RepID=A0A501X1I5_9GAMM|nr:hypothetical protein [Maribrevibacterium harenarium]TPE54306.1 hypothetical protein FJM67_05000 [Maribrevibacterium harenarium]
MDDDTLAPFVDALASALIMMVLVSIFFLVQTATSITAAAKLTTISDKEVDEQKPLFTPIIYRDVVEYQLDNNRFRYIVNFKLDDVHKDIIKDRLKDAKEIKVTINSNDSQKKSVVNIIAFINAMKLGEKVKVNSEILPSESVLSSLSWTVVK